MSEKAPRVQPRRLARHAAIFSFATGLSRIAGLVREIVASSYFGTSGAFSAFTIAFQIPNLVRSLVADAALSAAFVPVFTELLELRKRREAFQLAASLSLLIFTVLGALTALFILVAPWLMPPFTGAEFDHALDGLVVGLSRLLFPIVVLLGLNGLVVGILNSYEHFSMPAFAPLLWNAVIVAALVTLRPLFEGPDQLYAYAIGVLAGTLVQLLVVLPALHRVGFRWSFSLDFRHPLVKRVLKLMLPVTIGLGVINFDLVINSLVGSFVSEQAPRAIDAAFRIYMLPQGLFSVALATVLFPALSRFATRKDHDGMRRLMASGVRQILLLLIPAAAISVVLAEPITRLIYERGEFGPDSTEQVALALFWFSWSLPFAGINLLLTRAFFSLQSPWPPTVLAVGSLVVNAVVSLALYSSLGIAGPVIGTLIGSIGMAIGQGGYLRRRLGRLDARKTVAEGLRICLAAALLATVSYLVWFLLDHALGRSLPAQLCSVGLAIGLGFVVYAGGVIALKVGEVDEIRRLIRGRVARS